MRYFFVLALGRSGTQMLSGLLGLDPNARVEHEPHRYDPKIVGLRRFGQLDTVLHGLLTQRFAEVAGKRSDTSVYGETNSYLRYEAEWLRRNLDATVVHLSRDGREFVRSAYPRVVYTAAEAQLPILPCDSDPCAGRWSEMTRFEKLCWYWSHTNEMLRATVELHVRMEDVVSDYGYFKRKLLGPLDLSVSEDSWRQFVSRPKNTSSMYRRRRWIRGWVKPEVEVHPPIGRPSSWTTEMHAQFEEICGPTMKKLGYPAE